MNSPRSDAVLKLGNIAPSWFFLSVYRGYPVCSSASGIALRKQSSFQFYIPLARSLSPSAQKHASPLPIYPLTASWSPSLDQPCALCRDVLGTVSRWQDGTGSERPTVACSSAESAGLRLAYELAIFSVQLGSPLIHRCLQTTRNSP